METSTHPSRLPAGATVDAFTGTTTAVGVTVRYNDSPARPAEGPPSSAVCRAGRGVCLDGRSAKEQEQRGPTSLLDAGAVDRAHLGEGGVPYRST